MDKIKEAEVAFSLTTNTNGTCMITNGSNVYFAGTDKDKALSLLDALNKAHRPNLEQGGTALYVCWNLHEKGDKCDFEVAIEYQNHPQ